MSVRKKVGNITAYAAAVRGGYTGTYEEFCAEQANFAKNAQKVAEDRAAVEKLKTDTQDIKDAAVKDVGDAKNAALASIGNTASEKLTAIATAGSAQVKAVQDAGAVEVADVENAGAAERATLDAAAEEKTAEVEERIEAKGAAVLATIPEDYTETYQRALRNESRISRNEKRLTNLEQGITPDPYETDDTVAYSKDVPANALPFAEVGMVGGRTLKWNQLMDANKILTTTSNGITLTFNGDGSITVNGQATARVTFNSAGIKPIQVINGHKYYINCGNVTVHIGWAITTSENGTDEQIVTATEDLKGYPTIDVFSTETVFNNKTFFPKFVDLTVMYGAGNEPTSVEDCRFTSGYEPYDEGSLRSAPVTEVESVGVNLFGGEAMADKLVEVVGGAKKDATTGTVVFSANKISGIIIYNDFKPNTRYTFVLYGKNTESDSGRVNLKISYTDGTTESTMTFSDGTSESYCVVTTEPNKTVKSFYGSNQSGKTMLYYDKCGIFEGVLTADDFKPYTRSTLPIPASVQALDGYGWGVSDSVYNYVDWEKKQFVKQVEKIELDGTEPFAEWTSGGVVIGLTLDGVNYDYSRGSDVRGVCSHYNVGVGGVAGENAVRFRQGGDMARWYLVDTALTSLAEWKSRLTELYAAGNPVTVMYKLAEPVITDISDLLSEDNYIPVEGGGMITMVNEYEYAVPSEITYALKEAE